MTHFEKRWKPGDLFIYRNGERFEIGKVKRVANDGVFAYFSEGETAAKTPFDCMHVLANAHAVTGTSLGGKGREQGG